MSKINDQFLHLRDQQIQELTEINNDVRCVIHIGSATCENAAGAERVRKEFEKLIRASGRDDILIKQTGCTGRCAREPIVGVFIKEQIPFKYEKVDVEKVQQIFHDHVLGGELVPSLILDKKTSLIYSHVVVFCGNNFSAADTNWPEVFEEVMAEYGVPSNSIKIYAADHMGFTPEFSECKTARMMIMPGNITYGFADRDELKKIVQSHFIDGQTLSDMQIELDPMTKSYLSVYGDVSFFNKQTRLTLRHSGIIDPESLADYILHQGYESLAKALGDLSSQDVIDQVLASGLRGRGGGGYPTGRKWQDAVTGNDDPIRYVICNADEGDPGAFMDRSALEGDPFSIVEGMTIGSYAIGANKGFIYIRAEYPLAIERCRIAIEKAREAGLLGKNILGSGHDFDIEIRLGAGAFVCGEETALLKSIEGERGQPILRPPYPTESGLWGHPTVINNVETWANIPVILLYGPEFFSCIGTDVSKGTKVFALAGKVRNTGLVEVPMGTTLRDIVYDIGGGIPGGHALKAIQTGGPSGGFISEKDLDLPVDYESLSAIGSIMGSGGMIVLDETDCMVATAQFFLEFTESESCGKCVPCREGTLRMLEILKRITSGNGVMEDLDKLERLGNLVKKTSLCGLGQSAPNPILSVLKNFRDEFMVHIEEKRCPSHRCTQLIRYRIDSDKCTGCTLCARRCPVTCISGSPRNVHFIDQDKCVHCGECFNACKFGAVTKI